MNYLYSEELTSCTTWPPACNHKNGWFSEVKFWLFTKRVFVCKECENLINPSELK